MTIRSLKRQLTQARRQMRMNPCWSKLHHEALAMVRAIQCDLYTIEKHEWRAR